MPNLLRMLITMGGIIVFKEECVIIPYTITVEKENTFYVIIPVLVKRPLAIPVDGSSTTH